MITRDKSFYDVIKHGLGNASFQDFVDRFKQKYNIPQTQGFDWDPNIQLDFTYEQLLAELGIATLPTYVDIDSPPPYKSQDGFEIGKNKIPRFKHGFALNEKIIREQMIMLQRFGAVSITEASKRAIMDLLFDSVDKLLEGNKNALTYQRMQVVSTGQFSITDTNNPAGISNLTFDFGIPDANKQSLAGQERWWTNAAHTTEGTSSDPIKFLKDKKRAADDAMVPEGHFEMSKKLFTNMLEHSKVRTRVGLLYSPLVTTDAQALQVGQNLDDVQMKAAIERLVGASIEVRDTRASVEKFNKATMKIDKITIPGFNELNVSYVPNGKLGTIKAVEPIAVPDPAARLAWFDGGRTIVKQTFNTDTNTQYISSECTALVVPSTSRYWFVFTVTA